MKLVILDGFTVSQGDLAWPAFDRVPDTTLTVYDRTPADEVIARCSEAEAVLTNKVVFSRQVIQALPRLRYIGVLGTGYNVVDTAAASERGIVVTNIPGYSTASVAQMTLAHLLNATNHVAHYAEANSRGRWAEGPDFLWMDRPVAELEGKTMLVRGMGNIGTRVALLALALGMRVVAVSRRTDLPRGVERMTWDAALPEADVVSLHCPLTDQTRCMINTDSLRRMKSTAILINTGRGPLVDEEAVAQALCEDRLGAYCADVLGQEPPSPDNPLLSAPRCYLTPHIAWASREARARLMRIAEDNVRAFAEGRPTNVVNP